MHDQPGFQPVGTRVNSIKYSRSRLLFKALPFLFVLAIMVSFSRLYAQGTTSKRPNILLIVADDLGYADLGCYGGDIETPHIDQLAARGIRFSRFHTSPLCAPTRAMLLSGNDNHIAGMGLMHYQGEAFGYEGRLTNRIATVPEVLKMAGYHTYMAGKWHLGEADSSNPASKGFEHSFVNLTGAGNHYNDQGLFADEPVTPYTEDGKPAKWINGNYSTDFYTDKIIEYIDGDKDDNKPFFVFAAYTSPHWPLQVDEKYWRKYEGRYDDGYEKLRERRMASLKKAGMIPADAELPALIKGIQPWDALPAEAKKKEARKMELYAGMVDNLDFNVGRLIKHLEDIGQLDNTLIIFMSDNGAAGGDFYNHPHLGIFLKQHFNDDYENMGKPNSFISYGRPWAEAGSAPFKYFKSYTTEGGINTPMVICGPGVQAKQAPNDALVTLMDLAPTFYEAAQTTYPARLHGVDLYPLKGNSLGSLLSGKAGQLHNDNYVFALEHANMAMIRKGNWKITSVELPFAEENFQLYDLSKDLGEMHDLRKSNPLKYQELLAEWRKFKNEVKVQVPAPEDD